MDTYPKIKVICTPQTESERIIHASHKTITGFYYYHNFAVLPYAVPTVSSTVFLPNIGYKDISNYWVKVKELVDTIPIEAPLELVTAVSKKLSKYYDPKEKDVSIFQNEWEEIETEFWKIITPLIPEAYKNITEIEVRLTTFGTIASFGRIPFMSPGPLVVYIRKDANISHLGEAILSAVLRTDMPRLTLSWEAVESIVDYFIHRLADLKIFSNYQPTLASLHKPTEHFMEDSLEYMTSLGIRIEKPFQNNNDLILFNKKPITTELSELHNKILLLLLKHENEIVSYDAIGDIIWQELDDYSLWAIHKHMQRLRIRLGELGVNSYVIKSVKGRGYSLKN